MKRALAEKTLKEYLDYNYTKYEENCNETTIHTDRLCVYVTSDEIVGPHVRVDGTNYYFIPKKKCPKYATGLWTEETVTLPCNAKTYVADADSVCKRSFYSSLDISQQKRKESDGRWTLSRGDGLSFDVCCQMFNTLQYRGNDTVRVWSFGRFTIRGRSRVW